MANAKVVTIVKPVVRVTVASRRGSPIERVATKSTTLFSKAYLGACAMAGELTGDGAGRAYAVGQMRMRAQADVYAENAAIEIAALTGESVEDVLDQILAS